MPKTCELCGETGRVFWYRPDGRPTSRPCDCGHDPAPVGEQAVGDETRLSFTPEELGHVCEEAGQDALRAADVPELRSQLAAARAEIDRLKGRDFYDAWPSAQVREFGHLAPREFVAAHAAAVREESSDQVDTLAKALRRLLNVTYKWPDVQIAQKLAVEALAAVEKWGE